MICVDQIYDGIAENTAREKKLQAGELQAGFDLQLQKCILYPKTLEITRDNKIETQIPQNR